MREYGLSKIQFAKPLINPLQKSRQIGFQPMSDFMECLYPEVEAAILDFADVSSVNAADIREFVLV